MYRSLNHIYAQIIDDTKGVTLVSASSMDKDFNQYGGNCEAAKEVVRQLLQKHWKRELKQWYSTEADMFTTAESQLLQKAQEKAAWNSNKGGKDCG